MIKIFLLNNTNFNENDVNFIIEQINKKIMQFYIDLSKNDHCEKINKIDMTLYCNKYECDNNLYIEFTINYHNFKRDCNMIDEQNYLIDCECDVCIINDKLIFQHLINLMMQSNFCEFVIIENINFNLIK